MRPRLGQEARFLFLRNFCPFEQRLGLDLCKLPDGEEQLVVQLLLCRANIPAVRRLLTGVRISSQNNEQQNIFELNGGKGAKVYVSIEVTRLLLRLFRPPRFGILVGSFQRLIPHWLLEISGEASELVIEEAEIVPDFVNLLRAMSPPTAHAGVFSGLPGAIELASVLRHRIVELDLSKNSLKSLHFRLNCPANDSVRTFRFKCPSNRLAKAAKKVADLQRVMPAANNWVLVCETNQEVYEQARDAGTDRQLRSSSRVCQRMLFDRSLTSPSSSRAISSARTLPTDLENSLLDWIRFQHPEVEISEQKTEELGERARSSFHPPFPQILPSNPTERCRARMNVYFGQ
ncbi:hypothetical protein M3Y99_01888400 [Aphelenchoides fujianensis]|nr:hypothetical protein M3Y99_01888400 [Aphelenchoides fujianensis]